MRRLGKPSPPATRGRATRSLLAVALAGLALAGCGSGRGATAASAPSATGAGYPVTAAGITLKQQPTHIVSLGPTVTEMLFALGAGRQVVAVDNLSNYPGGLPRSDLSAYKPSAEAIAAMNPDLVVITNDTEKIKEQLTALKIPVYLAAAARTLDDSYAELTDLGTLTGHVGEARGLVTREKAEIAQLIAEVPRRAKPLTYYYELDQTFYSVTSKTFVGALFAKLGLVNIADAADTTGSGYPQLSAETIIKANPALIFLADTKCCGQSGAALAKRPGWSVLTAVQAGRVVMLDDDIASRWGPRVVDLLRTVVAAVKAVPAS